MQSWSWRTAWWRNKRNEPRRSLSRPSAHSSTWGRRRRDWLEIASKNRRFDLGTQRIRAFHRNFRWKQPKSSQSLLSLRRRESATRTGCSCSSFWAAFSCSSASFSSSAVSKERARRCHLFYLLSGLYSEVINWNFRFKNLIISQSTPEMRFNLKTFQTQFELRFSWSSTYEIAFYDSF